MKRSYFFTAGASILSLLTFLPGCFSQSDDAEWKNIVSKSCDAPADQRASFMARPLQYPITITLDPGFSADQKSAIQQAMAEWNAAGQRLIQQDLFQLGSDSSFTSLLKTTGREACNLPGISDDTHYSIVREASFQHWQSLNFNEQVPAATLRCTSGGKLQRQVVFMFTPIIDPAQFASVAVHFARTSSAVLAP